MIRKTFLVFIELNDQLFLYRFAKIQGQVVNPWNQTRQGQPVTKLKTPLQNMLVGNANLILRLLSDKLWIDKLKSWKSLYIGSQGEFRVLIVSYSVNAANILHRTTLVRKEQATIGRPFPHQLRPTSDTGQPVSGKGRPPYAIPSPSVVMIIYN